MIKIFAAEGTIIHDHISRPLLRNATYIHHSSQNEMIEVIVKSIIQQDLFEWDQGSKDYYYEMRLIHPMMKSCLIIVRFVNAKK